MTDSGPIGVFDSGVGGLTVMRAIADLLPNEHLVYLGDTARIPYGNRGPDTVRRYSLNAGRYLADHGIKVLVVACNTATAFGLPALQAALPVPVIGVVDPVSRRAAALSQTKRIGVLGTRGTVRSEVYDRAIESLGSDLHVIHQACPLFVPLAEEGWTEGPVVEAVAREYLEHFRGSDIDTLILGCTHYPILADVIGNVAQDIVGQKIALLDSATATAAELRSMLDRDGIASPGGANRMVEFLATDEPQQFSRIAGRFFGSELEEIRHVDLPGTLVAE